MKVPRSKMHAMLVEQGLAPSFPATDLPKRKRNNEESRMQQVVIKWWQLACRSFGVAEILLFSVPNGGGRSGPRVGAILKSEGLRAGCPDLMLATTNGKHFGLFIEMKTAKGVVSSEQEVFMGFLIARGYRCCVCRSAQQAIECITEYLNA